MPSEAYQLWIGGKYEPGSGEKIDIEDPATGDIIAQCQSASESDVELAIHTAHQAFKDGTWSKAPRHHRADVLEQAATLLLTQLPDLISLEVRQTGRAIREMQAQVPSLVRWFRYYAAVLRTEERRLLPTAGKLHNWVDRVPLGVVAQITPFNHPLLIAVKKLAPALAAGNSVVLKPSELTPLTSLLLGNILHKAGIPDGVFNVIPGMGDVTGKALVRHRLIRKVDLTGGTAAGRAIGSIVGGNLARYTAELGGKAPLIVLDNAHVDASVNGIAFGSFVASGQTCVASTRIIVHNSLLEEVQTKLQQKCKSIQDRMGSPSNPASAMGPVISAKQLQHIESLVEDALTGGARLIYGGKRMTGISALDNTDFSKGYFYPPSVLVLDPASMNNARIWLEEAFGPVVTMVGFETEEEAVNLANDTQYGLGAALWTSDLSQAFRVSEQIEAGIVWVNTHHRNDPSSPWGGVSPSSGVGSENGVEAYQAYTMAKSTIVNYASADESLQADDWFKDGGGSVRYG